MYLGKGELLKLALELGDACQKKKSRPLAVSYVYIDVDFSKQPHLRTLYLPQAYRGKEVGIIFFFFLRFMGVGRGLLIMYFIEEFLKQKIQRELKALFIANLIQCFRM